MRCFRSKLIVPAATAALLLCISSLSLAQLKQYVSRPDPAFQWKYLGSKTTARGKIYKLHLVSQKWHGITWEHQLEIYQPHALRYSNVAILFVTGGHASERGARMGFTVAEHAGMRVAVLYEIPNQPLFGGRVEDALIAYTFVQYLHTGDASWPLLFPMVKSVVKAMDALQAFAPKGWGKPLSKFIVTGASKRGWTSWLTAATGDPRVVAIMPMVINTLNMIPQMKHQIADYGHYSAQIDDYVNAGLLKPAVVNSTAGQRLWHMVDPYSYRESLTLPKLIINATNDQYWTQDAMSLYWNGLAGGKWVLFVPNAIHNLKTNRQMVLNTTGAFARHIASSTPMPQLSWKFAERNGNVVLTVHGNPAPHAARLWFAKSSTLDFRKSHWKPTPMRETAGVFMGNYAVPKSGNVAVFGELDYTFEGKPYTLSTQVHIAPNKLP